MTEVGDYPHSTVLATTRSLLVVLRTLCVYVASYLVCLKLYSDSWKNTCGGFLLHLINSLPAIRNA